MKRMVSLSVGAVFLVLLGSLPLRGAVLVQEAFDNFQLGVRPGGWTFTNCNANSDTYTLPGYYGSFGNGFPSLKFDATVDVVTTPSLTSPAMLQFWFRGYYTVSTDAFLVKRYDGLGWNQLTYICPIPLTATTLGPLTVDRSTLRLQFSWVRGPAATSLAFDDVLITGGAITPTPIPSATPSRSPSPAPTATAPPPPTATPPPVAGPIRGRVYDRDTGTGLGSVTLWASGTSAGGIATSNSSGNYQFTGLPVGFYYIHAKPSGIPPTNATHVDQYYNQAYSMAGATRVPTNSSGIDFPLVRGGVIAGTVTDSDTGQGMADITIAGYDSAGTQACWTRTASGGTYSLRPFLSGDYRILANTMHYEILHPGECYQNQWYSQEDSLANADQIAVVEGTTTSGIDLELLKCTPSPTATPKLPPTPQPTITPPGNLEIYEVWSGVPGAAGYGNGAGQATLIWEPVSGTAVLCDCGSAIYSSPAWAAARELLYLMEYLGIDHIDYLVISHYDYDHYMGVPYLVNGTQQPGDSDFVRYGAGKPRVAAYDRGGSYRADGEAIQSAYLTAVSGVRQSWTAGAEIDLGIPGGLARLKCMARGNEDNSSTPGGDVIHYFNRPDYPYSCSGDQSENAKSIVSLLSYGDFDMWIGGDAASSLGPCAPVEETVGEVIRNDLNSRLDVLLVDHHGSEYHTSQEFLDLVRPPCALIAVWNNSVSYDFPRAAVCDRLSGTVECGTGRQSILQTSDGRRVCSICGFTARCHIRVSTDSNFYTISTDNVEDRATDCQGVTDAAWTNHPVNREPMVTPTPPPHHLVISQMAASGPAGGNDEFCEIYNSTDQDLDVGGWKLNYMTASGASVYTRVEIPYGTNIPACHFYLMAHDAYAGPVAPDARFNEGLSDSGGHLIVVDSAEREIDRIGWGTAQRPEGQAVPVPNWAAGNTLLRKALSGATAAEMCPGGSLYGYGNAFDSGDNQFDFVAQNVCNRELIRNSGSGSWCPAQPTPTPIPQYELKHLVIDSGDYNGDGTSDIAIFRPATGFWAVRNFTTIYFGSSSDLPVSGDYNGDGTTDIATFRGDNGLWAIRGISRVYFGSISDIPSPGDFDGDGKSDAAIFRDAANLWSVRGITRLYYGSTGDEPVPGDYNGDGIAEIAIFRSYYSLWSINQVSRLYFGGAGDWPVPRDYDGDGVTDVAVFRGYYGLWCVRNLTRTNFGLSTDYPVPADFRGTGSAGLGVFRPPAGFWSVKDLTSVYYGTINDLPVTR